MANRLSLGKRLRIVRYAAGLLLLAFLPACATSKGAKSTKSFQVLEATQQTTLPGRSETPPFTTYRFRIVWKSQSEPAGFYWRPDKKNWFDLVREDLDKYRAIHYGDTLVLTTRPDFASKPVPSAVQKMPVKSLYFETSTGSKWMYMPVAVKKLADIALP
jgi:hypothetical protein